MKTKNTQKKAFAEKREENKTTYSKNDNLVKTSLLAINITSARSQYVLEYISHILQNSHKKLIITTPNPEIVMLARRLPSLKNAINNADLALCDGVGLLWAARVLGKPLKEQIIGTNFMEMLIAKVNDWPITVGFLGGRAGVAEKVAECLVEKYPKLKIGYVGQEWNESGFENAKRLQREKVVEQEANIPPVLPEVTFSSKNSKSGLLQQMSSSQSNSVKKVDILFVAFGAPKQELWMYENKNHLPVRVMMGVGGAFDQIIDPSLRPPDWIHSLGLGWLYRLIRQPWRIKRQLALIQFVGVVLKEKLRMMSSRTFTQS